MAFVCDYEIECVDRDVEFFSILLDFFLAAPDGVAAEQVDGHSLNRRNVHERVAWFRGLKVGSREKLGIEFFFFCEILFLESLTVYLVDFVELEALFRLERGERANCLRGERTAVHKEENAFR